ncbi:MAG: class I SAM-dependent methyltransferase [Candidatus Aminicenantes bacterium]|nr:class I SAM-dependent methyltransferase [Candidatus Aminicenantes bacterium]
MRSNRMWLILIPILFLISSLATFLPSQQVHRDVPYVPSPYEVVEEMLRLAQLKPSDILYDLGCGDGRIVVEAAKRGIKKAVGIDIDPERIAESWENAKQAKVTNLVEFRQGDLFTADIHDASVVTLYLLTYVNLKLRPKLLSELKPGTRVVSHNYAMDTWRPDQTTTVVVDDSVHTVYFWIIPANITGTWNWNMPIDGKKIDCRLEVDQHFQYFQGRLIIGRDTVIVGETKLEGAKIDFLALLNNRDKKMNLNFTGLADGDRITGTIIVKSNNTEEKIPWRATRDPKTKKPLDTGEGAWR